MEMKDRIKKIRKDLDLTQQVFAERIGTTANVLTNYETGRRNPSSSVINNICKTFDINEEWLRTGEGDMHIQVPEDDEIAALVYDLLEPDGNEFYEIILETMRAFNDLSPNSQKAIRELCGNVLKNMKKRGD